MTNTPIKLTVDQAIHDLNGFYDKLSDISQHDDVYKKYFLDLIHYVHCAKIKLGTDWETFCNDAVNTKLFQLLLENPFISRTYFKPRGYAGDAVMMDYIYQLNDLHDVSALGKKLLTASSQTKSFIAVRERALRFGQLIDTTADKYNHTEILSIACGHARELMHSVAIKRNQLNRFIALDQDGESISYLEQCYSNQSCISTLRYNIKELISPSRNHNLGKFDLIYASGLFDYLPSSLAIRLVDVMFSLLKPGGKMHISNFLDNLEETAFMECFQRWNLIYRSLDDMNMLTVNLDPDMVLSKDKFIDSVNSIGYVDVIKKGS